jgi:hypothetical protein
MRPPLRDLFRRFHPQKSIPEEFNSKMLKKGHGNIYYHKHKQILNECLEFLKNNGITVDNDLRRLIEFFFSTDHHVALEDIRRLLMSTRLISRIRLSGMPSLYWSSMDLP